MNLLLALSVWFIQNRQTIEMCVLAGANENRVDDFADLLPLFRLALAGKYGASM